MYVLQKNEKIGKISPNDRAPVGHTLIDGIWFYE